MCWVTHIPPNANYYFSLKPPFLDHCCLLWLKLLVNNVLGYHKYIHLCSKWRFFTNTMDTPTFAEEVIRFPASCHLSSCGVIWGQVDGKHKPWGGKLSCIVKCQPQLKKSEEFSWDCIQHGNVWHRHTLPISDRLPISTWPWFTLLSANGKHSNHLRLTRDFSVSFQWASQISPVVATALSLSHLKIILLSSINITPRLLNILRFTDKVCQRFQSLFYETCRV